MSDDHPVHGKKTDARILLSSVFGPYCQDDDYGSRHDNPMELYHNQVTRVQGPFSLRMFHRSFGLMLIQENLDAPTTLLDFPDRERFISELQAGNYDIVGISGIIPNFQKVREMCSLVRRHSPHSTIVVGGHVANLEGLGSRIEADYVVRGEGIRWFRRFLGQDENMPIKHPAVLSGFNTRALGIPLGHSPKVTAAILIPSVGCPMGCNFCSTSALFGGKGKFINFYDTGDELFEVMCGIEGKLGVRSFFALDENFLLHRKRALRLLELMRQHGKSWSIYIFSSAKAIRSYSMDELLGLGVSWVWMGLEGESSGYDKLSGMDTGTLVRELQSNGIKVLGSSIIGLESHSPQNIGLAIDFAVGHNTVFHQFMLYTPTSGTPLHAEMSKQGILLSEDECSLADAHGQRRFNYKHAHIADGQEGGYLLDAFRKDFEVNGPSMSRLFRVMLDGHILHRKHPDLRIRKRILEEGRALPVKYASAAWAIRESYRDNPAVFPQLDSLVKDFYKHFGLRARIIAPVIGRYILRSLKKEKAALAAGMTYEPPTFYRMNAAALALPPQRKIENTSRKAMPDDEGMPIPSPVFRNDPVPQMD